MSSVPNIDKSTWHTVRFGDVAREVKDTEQDPLAKGITRYVGLADLDPDSIQLKRWSEIADGQTTFTRLFRKGQVLFGRRRAYQRKAAVAPFDGICSGDIIVMEAKPDKLLPELLPFLIHTEGFFDYAIQTSAGSLSPRTKWPHLAQYEFALPPLAEQRRIAEVLTAVEETTESWLIVANKAQSLLDDFLIRAFKKQDWDDSMLELHVAESAYGPRFSSKKYSDNGPVGCIRTTDLSEDGTIDYSTIPHADLDPDSFKDHVLKPGDFLISRSGTVGIGCVHEEQGYPILPGAFLIRLRLKSSLSPHFLKEYVNSPVGKQHMDRIAQGAVQRNIRGSLLLEQKIPIPDRTEQEAFLRQSALIRENLSSINSHIVKLSRIKKSLLDSWLS
jgi:type I restriction enzyme, S subunit